MTGTGLAGSLPRGRSAVRMLYDRCPWICEASLRTLPRRLVATGANFSQEANMIMGIVSRSRVRAGGMLVAHTFTLSGRDQQAGNLQISSNTARCP